MEFVMPTWLYMAVAVAFMVALYGAKAKWFNEDLSKPLNREDFMFNLFLWVFIVFLGCVWPVLVVMGFFFGLGLGGYEIYKRFN